MRKLFAIILFSLVSLGATAQQAAPSSTTTVDSAAVATPSLVGSYTGNLVEGHGANLFKVAILHQDGAVLKGTAMFWYPETGCPKDLSLKGVVREDKTIAIEMHGNVRGCNYTMTLQSVAAGVLDGNLEGFMKPYRVRLTQ